MTGAPEFDLVALVADADQREVLHRLLAERSGDLGIRRIRFDIRVHTRRDPGVRGEAVDVLRPFIRSARFSLVVFDHHGSGREDTVPADLERDLEDRLERNGWKARTAVLVLAPELEVWAFGDDACLGRAVRWKAGLEPRGWLTSAGLWDEAHAKPVDPKACLKKMLTVTGRRLSPVLYGELAAGMAFPFCTDRAFVRLRERLRAWFPADGSQGKAPDGGRP